MVSTTKKRNILIILVILLCGVVMNGLMCSSLLYVREYVIETPKVSRSVTIVQLSDMHEESFGVSNEKLFEVVNSLSPHLIVITGDIVDHTYEDPDMDYIYNFSARAAALAPTYFITGNHERNHAQEVKDAMALNGATILDGTIDTIKVARNTISVGGIDDATITDTEVTKIDMSDTEGFRLLLAHNPEPFLEEYSDSAADLVLSGHTHGGQIRFPLGSAILTEEGWFPEYSHGLYVNKENGMQMILSAGLGSSIVPFRLFVRPEITLIRLVPSTS